MILPAQPDFTPDRAQAWAMLRDFLPPGRAFGTHEAGSAPEAGTIERFLWALSGPWLALEERIAAGLLEWDPETADATLGYWNADYGLPDECDPYAGDLVARVRRPDDEASISWWTEVCGRLGLAVQAIRWLKGDAGDPDHPGVRATLFIRIDTAASFTGDDLPATTGSWTLGVNALGDPDNSRLECMLDRWLPAEMAAIVEFV